MLQTIYFFGARQTSKPISTIVILSQLDSKHYERGFINQSRKRFNVEKFKV